MYTSEFQSTLDVRPWQRRGFLQMLAAAASSAAIFPGYAIATGTTVSIKSYGAKGDGVADDTHSLQDAMNRNLTGTVLVPAGTYLIRNPFYVQGFCGRLQCDAAARFVFLDPTKPGWSFQKGKGAVILNLRVGWKTQPTVRIGSSAGLQLDHTTNTWVDGCVVENSSGAGINCWICVSPKITNSTVQNTTSNGFMFANCQTPVVLNCKSVNTGDDGFEFTYYKAQPAVWGGYARNLTVVNSRARGISVNGQSFIEINNFNVDRTATSGILAATDYTYDTPTPESIRFTNGTIKNAGTVTPPQGNQFGIEVFNVKSVSISAVTTIGSFHRGICTTAPAGSISLRDIVVQSNLRDSGAELKAKELAIDLLRCENSPGYGIYIANCPSVTARRLETLNAARSFSLRRAIWLENNAQINVQNLGIYDNQAHATGYVTGCYGAGQKGSISGISSIITSGKPLQVLTSGSPGVKVVT